MLNPPKICIWRICYAHAARRQFSQLCVNRECSSVVDRTTEDQGGFRLIVGYFGAISLPC